ncbi:hypothetical protein C5167_035757 [Papaver somniferum]|nr:hypothetical protein C5167_035757 [Papaver somniferum]
MPTDNMTWDSDGGGGDCRDGNGGGGKVTVMERDGGDGGERKEKLFLDLKNKSAQKSQRGIKGKNFYKVNYSLEAIVMDSLLVIASLARPFLVNPGPMAGGGALGFKVLELLSFQTCIHSCLEYLGAVQWVGEGNALSHIMKVALTTEDDEGRHELANLHKKFYSPHRHFVNFITTELLAGIRDGKILLAKDVRQLLLQTWFQPLVDDYSSLRSHGSFDQKVEENIERAILELTPEARQTEDRFGALPEARITLLLTCTPPYSFSIVQPI